MIQIATTIAATILGMIAVVLFLPLPVKIVNDWTLKREARSGKRTLIWGAGGLGEQIAVNLINDDEQRKRRHLIGFIDDNPKKTGESIKLDVAIKKGLIMKAGPYHIWGTTVALEDLLKRLKVDEIVRGFYEGPESRVSEIEKLCTYNSIKYIDGSSTCVCQLPLPTDD